MLASYPPAKHINSTLSPTLGTLSFQRFPCSGGVAASGLTAQAKYYLKLCSKTALF